MAVIGGDRMYHDIVMHRVRVAMPFNPHSVDQKETHHER